MFYTVKCSIPIKNVCVASFEVAKYIMHTEHE